MSHEKNEYVSQLKTLKAFCNKEGVDLVASHIRDMQVDRQRNIELDFVAYFESHNPDFFEKIGDACSMLTPKSKRYVPWLVCL